MARIYKPVKGKGRKWYIDYIDGLGIRRRVAGFRDKQATEQRAAELERTSERERSGLIDRFAEHVKTPLVKHADDWAQSLVDGERSKDHARLSANRVRSILTASKAVFWGELDANRVKRYLAERRAGGLSIESSNHYLRAAKGFARWMVRSNRARENPLACLSLLNARTDRRHDRRALSADELRRILETTRNGVTRFGMAREDRAMLYTLAVETGLRVGELRTLTWGACDLDGDPPTLTVLAAYSKHGREDVQPLRPATAAMLDRWRVESGSGDRLHSVFPSMAQKPAKMLKADLADARADWIEEAEHDAERKRRTESDFLLYCDHSGQFADFHALRHTYITNLARGGVHPKIAQQLARHSTITLTMDRYSHTVTGELVDGLDALPTLDRTNPTHERQRATGTCDNRPEASATRSAIQSAIPVAPQKLRTASRCTIAENDTDVSRRENTAKQGAKCTPLHADAPPCTDDSELGRGGLEPPTHGFSVRCSTN